MAEIAGIFLGALSLVGPAYQCYVRCEELFKDIRYHTRAFQACAAQLFVERTLFKGTCELLLSMEYPNSTAREMLDNPSHPLWNELRAAQNDEAVALKVAVSQVQSSLENIERHLQGVLETVTTPEEVQGDNRDLATRADVLVPNQISQTPSTLTTSPALFFRRFRGRVNWALRAKPQIKDCLAILSKQNRALSQLREQNKDLTKARRRIDVGVYRPFERERQPLPLLSGPLRSGPSHLPPELFSIRESAKRLFEDMALTGACKCHRLHLRLDVMPGGGSLGRKFRLVMSPGAPGSDPNGRCVCLLVEAVADRKGKGPAVSKETMTNGDPGSHKRPGTVLSLCTMLQQTSGSGDGQLQRPIYLGLLPVSKADASTPYQHVLYRETCTLSVSDRQSLSQMIATQSRLLPRLERMRMAVVLSLSVLEFGSFESNSWFAEHWRSRDVFFFLDNKRDDQSIQLEPHLITSVSSGSRLPSSSQLISLVVVLTEIGFGRPLGEIDEGSGIPGIEDPFAELLKIQRLINLRRISGEAGPRYEKVVQRLLIARSGD